MSVIINRSCRSLHLNLGLYRCLHVAASRSYPRSASGRRQTTNAETASDDIAVGEDEPATDKWMRFVSSRPRAVLEPLDRQRATSFGSVRLDSDNKVRLHGHDDAYEEAAHSGEVVSVEDSETAQERKAFSEVRVSPAGGDRNRTTEWMLFENPKQRIFVPCITSARREARQEKTQQRLDQGVRRRDRPFSFASSDEEQNPTTFVPPIEDPHTSKASSEQKKDSANFFDEQYLSNLEGSIPSSLAKKDVHKHLEDTSPKANFSQELNDVDQQYFQTLDQSNNKSDEKPIEFDTEDSRKMQELVKESTSDLGYIDAQIFGHNPMAEEKTPKKDPPPKDYVGKKAKIVRGKVEKATYVKRPLVPVEKSALAYVEQFRQEQAGTSPSKAFTPTSKEGELSMIGVSLAKRMQRVSGGLEVNEDNFARETADGSEQVKPNDGYRLRVSERFQPTDLNSLTSLELVKILRKAILYDNHDIVAVNKPYGLDMFGSGQHSLVKYLPKLAEAVEAEELLTVHRLDKTTSGIVLLAKSRERHDQLTELFRTRKIDKRYWTLVCSVPEPKQGIINIPLSETELKGGRYRMTVNPDYRSSKSITNKRPRKKNALPAVTEYRVLGESKFHAALLEAKPITGYKHQIRVHLGLGLSCPIIGDHKYTYPTEVGKPQKLFGPTLQRLNMRQSQVRDLPIFLHAKHIQIPEVVAGKSIWVDAPIPHFFNRVMGRLKLSPQTFVRV